MINIIFNRLLTISFLIIGSALSMASLHAQSGTVQVVTKTVNRQISYSKGDLLKINAEKSQVDIQGWDKNYIQLTLKLVSKNKKKEDAELDLQYLKYKIVQKENVIELSNYFQTDNPRIKIKSNLQAKYYLMVPKSINAEINVLYGEIGINNTSGNIKTEVNFGQLRLEDINGILDVKSNYGDITAKNLNVTMTCQTDKANIRLLDIMGKYSINSAYGSITVETSKKLKGFKAIAKNTSLQLSLPAFEDYNYSLSTSYADINLPQAYADLVSSTFTQKKEFNKQFNSAQPTIEIATTFSNIIIQSTNTISKK